MDFISNNNDFKLEQTSVWSFPDRGNWATHSGNYRGNWSPYIPRNLILRYSNENDWVLDPFVGSGTTAIEAALLNRNFIGVDINQKAVDLTQNNLISIESKCKSYVKVGNANNLDFTNDNSVDLVCMHPPYCNIIKYSQSIAGDISLLEEQEFYEQMRQVAYEGLRVLKKGKFLGILIADMRKHGSIVPMGFNIMNIFREVGFDLKDIVIKEQHNCSSTDKWTNMEKRNFLLIQHEYLFIFKK